MIGKDLKNLFDKTKEVVDKHEKESKGRGEDFNIFSVLGMESNETKTHSGMLVALLDPTGNHYQETTFLKLFLEEIGYDYSNENLSQVKVKAEHNLGAITEDYLSGGFIDILISFPSGKAIAIENKIFAGDQPKQMYRYSLYKKGFCELYYMNLYGGKPSSDSLHSLKDQDYKIITYRNQILEWLEKCIQAVTKGSILETSIRQYYILIKQLTNTMDNKLEKELNNIIFENLEEAKYIHSHYMSAVEQLCRRLRKAVFEGLVGKLSKSFTVEYGNDVTYFYSQIWIYDKESKHQIRYGIESFATPNHDFGKMFVGIVNKEIEIDPHGDNDFRWNTYWPVIRHIEIQEENIDMGKTEVLQKLSQDPEYFTMIVSQIVSQSIDFISTYHKYFMETEILNNGLTSNEDSNL
jgi:hypothetical protein